MVLYFEDFEEGQTFITPGKTVTEADVAAFSAWTGDVNPIHTDAVFAANTRFGQRLGHGLLGVAWCMGLMSRIGIFEGSALAMLGLDDWKFLKPIYINDTIHVRITITDKRLTSGGKTGIINRQFELINQHEEVIQRGHSGVLVMLRPAP
ncbi:MaoC/PaaZ C-terminal domain-containing protein [Castellaniella sp.]|uniref:MaoC/PaaZ C-terminal domain-containing protein n=1 Tax=Castellaniella sp. TaxID=1955812 RepID=UPI0035688DA8